MNMTQTPHFVIARMGEEQTTLLGSTEDRGLFQLHDTALQGRNHRLGSIFHAQLA